MSKQFFLTFLLFTFEIFFLVGSEPKIGSGFDEKQTIKKWRPVLVTKDFKGKHGGHG